MTKLKRDPEVIHPPGTQGFVDQVTKDHKTPTAAKEHSGRCIVCGKPTSNRHPNLQDEENQYGAHVCASHRKLTSEEIKFIRRQQEHTCVICKGKGFITEKKTRAEKLDEIENNQPKSRRKKCVKCKGTGWIP